MLKKVTLIVGGTKGIGSVIKQAFVKRGDLVYTASRSELTDPNHFIIDLPNKFTISEEIKFNYLIFAHRYRGNDWDDDFHVTVKGVDLVINRLKGSFVEEAAIVVLGSNASHFIFKEQSASYHASRAALGGLVKYYAATLGHMRIRCNLVLPATVIKPENEHFFSDENTARKMIERITPLQRMGSANDVANIIEFLCSEKSSFITGQTFSVDGGLSTLGQESVARQCLNEKHPNER